MQNKSQNNISYSLNTKEIPPTVIEKISDAERQDLTKKITHALKKQKAIIVAHYYTDADCQILADMTGGCVSDSLEMARFGHNSNADTLIVCGVRFMGETAKILNREKRVLMPDLHAECSLDISCPIESFSAFCDLHSERTVVVYANTSAEVKARADWVVTSGSAIEVIKHLSAKGEKIIWAPDKYLGEYVKKATQADMLVWQGSCIVHEEFKGKELEVLRAKHPDAKVLVHPESPSFVVEQGDYVGSTTGIIQTVKTWPDKKFIIATDKGIFHKIKEIAPSKILLEAPTAGKSATCVSCANCPWMAMNSLRKLLFVLEEGENEIYISDSIIEKAKAPILKLLNFTKNNINSLAGDA